MLRTHNAKSSLAKTLSLKNWISPSAIADYKIILINKAIFLICIPLLITKIEVATPIFESMHLLFSQPNLQNTLPSWFIIGSFTLFILVFDDFARFYLHKLMHEIPWLWQFHKTHHSATVLTPLTVLRTHPVEGIIFALRTAVVQGVSIAIFVYLFADKVDLYTVLKVNVFIFVFNIAGSNLRHSHITIRYWKWLENFLISPAQHQIHHSIKARHFNKNYGAIFAFWDKLFNTHHYSEANFLDSDSHSANPKPLFGLGDGKNTDTHSIYNLYIVSFINIYNSCKQRR
jgi:sterol desaturase/sphingolipid hydroxylase (fatty acid hydroxylase superfamily)